MVRDYITAVEMGLVLVRLEGDVYIIDGMIIGFGATVLDVVVHTNKAIVLRDKNPIAREVFQVGGVIPTVLMLLARMGIPCKLYSAVGEDPFGKFLLEKLEKEGIDTRAVIKTKEATPVSVAVVEPKGGERTGLTARGFFTKLRENQMDLVLPADTGMLVVDGHNPIGAVALLRQAKKRNIRSVMDLGTYKPGMEPLMKEVDVAVAPEGYVQRQWPKERITGALANMRAYGIQVAVVTMGKEGCMVSCEDEVFHQPAYPVTAVDTNGAGDIFLGALSYGLYSQWEVRSSVQFAAAVAALSCEHTEKDDKLLRTLVNSALQGNQPLPIIPEGFKTLIG